MSDLVLSKPTVAEIIAVLSKFPPDHKFTLDDADTRWTIDVIHIAVYDGEVQFYGVYEEMGKA